MKIILVRISKYPLLFRNGMLDFIQHMADAGHHVCCGETNDMKAIAVQPFSAADVVQYLLRFSMSIA
ncbi:MAG TPA: hypothetical protein VLC74_10105, partial [Rhizomicrobium sp.]|nr:hypothetical protein [Rhizomicrobium sp.]